MRHLLCLTPRLALIGVPLLGLTWGLASAQEAGVDAVIKKCKAELAGRAQVAVETIQVTIIDEVTWRDTSLGCPEPGKVYAQVLVPGYRIVLEAAEKSYEYHTDRAAKNVVYCAKPGAEPGGPPAKAVVYYTETITDEPNLNRKLLARDARDPNVAPVTVLEACTDFAVSPTGLVLAKRRTSRSTHELVTVQPGGAPVVALGAFDFAGLTWLGPSADYVVLVRRSPAGGWQLFGGRVGSAPAALDWVPDLGRALGVKVQVLQGLVVVSVLTTEDSPEREVTILDLQGRKVIAKLRGADPTLGILPPSPAP
jgi:hypothetical protein